MGILHTFCSGRTKGLAFVSAVITGIVGITACGSPPAPAPTTSAAPKMARHWSPDKPAVIAFQGGVGYGLGGTEATVRNAIQKVGVSVIHIPVVLNSNDTAVVWPSTKITDDKCARAEDWNPPEGTPDPLGSYVYNLNDDAVLQGVVCDKTDPAYPNQDQNAPPGTKISRLVDILRIGTTLDQSLDHLWFDIELITDPVDKKNTATPEKYVSAVVRAIREVHFDNIVISSFDWRTLPLVHNGFTLGTESIPGLTAVPTVALVRSDTFYSGSPWLDTLNFNDVHGDLIEAASALGVDGISPDFLASAPLPQPDDNTPPGHVSPLLVSAQFLERAHKAGLRVFPRIINNRNDIDQQLKVCQGSDSQLHLDRCVDGFYTAYPDLLNTALGEIGANRPPKLSPR